MTERNAPKGNSQNPVHSKPQEDDADQKAGGNQQAGRIVVQPVPPGGGEAGPKDQPGDAPGNNRKGGGNG